MCVGFGLSRDSLTVALCVCALLCAEVCLLLVVFPTLNVELLGSSSEDL